MKPLVFTLTFLVTAFFVCLEYLLNTRSILSLKTTVATDLGVRKNNTNTAGDLAAVANQHPKKLPLGLYTPHPAKFAPAPESARKKVCLRTNSTHYKALASAFNQNDYQILYQNDVQGCRMIWFFCNGYKVWKKKHRSTEIQPWQRRHVFPFIHLLTVKATMYEIVRNYTNKTGVAFDFLPETYLLYNSEERKAFANKLENGNGMNMSWVLKSSQGGGGKHVQIAPPNSDILVAAREYIQIDHGRDIFHNSSQIDHVQRLVCPLLPYRGQQFDIRFYVAVVSGDPLIAYYHDGIIRSIYENKYVMGVVATFVELENDLQQYVTQHPELDIPEQAREDPLGHIRNQLKDISVKMILASRDVAWGGFNTSAIRWQNGFTLLGGDAMIDTYLQVHIIELNSCPGLGDDGTHATHTIREEILPPLVGVVDEITDKQQSGQAVFPIRSEIGKYELIYTDDNWFSYNDFQRKKDIPC